MVCSLARWCENDVTPCAAECQLRSTGSVSRVQRDCVRGVPVPVLGTRQRASYGLVVVLVSSALPRGFHREWIRWVFDVHARSVFPGRDDGHEMLPSLVVAVLERATVARGRVTVGQVALSEFVQPDLEPCGDQLIAVAGEKRAVG